MAENDVNEDLLDYEEEEATEAATGDAAKEANGVKTKKVSKFRFVSIFPLLELSWFVYFYFYWFLLLVFVYV